MGYSIQTSVDAGFDETVDATIDALGDEGFGVLSDIDVQATLEQKIGEEFRNYRILGACIPALAFEALSAEIELGTLLPCNVVVYETDDGTVVVSAVDPETLLDVADNRALDDLAEDVGARLERVLGALDDEFDTALDD